MSKFLGTVEFEGTNYACYGEFDRPDNSVGYNGSVTIEDVRVAGMSIFEALKDDIITYFEDELHYELC